MRLVALRRSGYCVIYGSGWIDQWNRLLRWRERLRRDRDDWQDSRMGTEHFLDEFYATFQAIWHLKDWLHNDVQTQVTGKQVDDWVNSRGVGAARCRRPSSQRK
jgi:hypothetical protein